VRQFITARFWITIVVLAALGLMTFQMFRWSTHSSTGLTAPTTGTVHRIDLVSRVYTVSAAPNFAVTDGRTTANMALTLDGTRTMAITPGTPADISCTNTTPNGCVVAAQLLGDAVLWFALVDASATDTASAVTLPGVVELIGTTQVRLANDWLVNRSTTVVRSCADDTASLKDFVSTYGDKATASFDLTSQKLVKVTCAALGGG
jgi:hypothetical protein